MLGVQSSSETPFQLRCWGPAARLTLGDELLLELLQKLQVEQVIGRERLFPHHRLHRLHILPDGVAGVLRDGRAAVRQADAPCNPAGRQSGDSCAGSPLPGLGSGSGKHQPSPGHLLPGCVTRRLGDTPGRVCMPGLSLCDQLLFKALWHLQHPQFYLYIIILYIIIHATQKKSGLLSAWDSCSRTSYGSGPQFGALHPLDFTLPRAKHPSPFPLLPLTLKRYQK